jgi:hypothetical protein
VRKVLYIAGIFLDFLSPSFAQTVPKELWGTWVVRQIVPTSTISCWGEKEAKALLGTEIEYSAALFRWNKVVMKNPKAETKIVTAVEFHGDNSGGGANDSQVNFQQLGIKTDRVTQVVIQHPNEATKAATTEIPGDQVLIKDKNRIIFSVCNVYFEAERISNTPGQPSSLK